MMDTKPSCFVCAMGSGRRIAAVILSFLILNMTFATEQDEFRCPKSPRTGMWLSLGATLIPSGIGWLTRGEKTAFVGPYIIATGLAFGPSVGHFYAGQWARGCLGIGLRAGISGAFVGLFVISATPDENYSTALAIFLTGAGILFSEIIWDIANVRNSVYRYNRSFHEKHKLNLVPEIDMQRNKYGLKIIYNH